ncbi:MAG TPA: DUF4249 domain-containing protein [Niastella sp.]|nr:DUF4249 domain-containing protein [Niastella sp.]
MRTVKKYRFLFIMALIVSFVSCERNFDIALEENEPQLIVEAYINNEMPLYNYVILGRSQGYYDNGFENIPVTGATVTITEGTLADNNIYNWDQATKKRLKEGKLPQFGNITLPGVYFDSMLSSNQLNRALKGTPGKHYLLEIEAAGKRYSAITKLLPVIPVDSLSSGYHFLDEDDDTAVLRARLTVHYQDPDTIGNTQLYYWRHSYDQRNFGWGGLGTNRFTPGTDELVNGQYIHLTHSNGFELKDSVNYFLVSVERKVYNFWDSFNKARSNGGPFSTPVKLLNTIEGENVIGCFSGFSLSTKSIVIK